MAKKDKGLKKLRRHELLEILLEVTQRNEDLEKEVELLKKQLETRQIILEESGSIAEAALRLNDIFASAQKAADLYVESVKHRTDCAEETTPETPADENA